MDFGTAYFLMFFNENPLHIFDCCQKILKITKNKNVHF
jgi:hypothetical protein